MNKRIEELADQAGVMSMLDVVDHETGDKVRFFTFKEEGMNKFVELIAKQILTYAEDGDLDFMKFMIKKNFGVE